MKKDKKRGRVALALVGLMVAAILVVASAFASVYAYRQITEEEASTSVLPRSEGRQVEEDASQSTSESENGVRVIEVDPDSPAGEVGLSSGAVILALDGEEVNNPAELVDLINEHEAGDTVSLRVLDGDEEKEFEVTLASAGPYLGITVGRSIEHLHRFEFDFDGLAPRHMPEGFPRRFRLPEEFFPDNFEPLIPFEDFDEFEESHRFRIPVIVISVVAESPAEAAGIMSGDVLIAVDDVEISSQQDLEELFSQMDPGDSERAFLGVRLPRVRFSDQFDFQQRSG
jgi:PDZ domain-containing secreted protein